MALPVDAKAYYGYLFAADKKPTKVLDALLRGIAIHIADDVGDKDEKSLTPTKLANFYKAVPHPSISWIYTSIGCQHTLQPTANDFEPPSIPALTTRGFVRWQSIEILLGPEEHVPFIQTAVKNWGIKHPDTGESFPADLPKEAFPVKCDVEIEKWHSACAAKLRERASPGGDDDDEHLRPELPPRPKVRVQTGYTHVHARPPNRPTRAETEYFPSRSRVSSARPLSYTHVSGTGPRPVRPVLNRSPTHRARQFLAPEEEMPSPRVARTRRRSFPENLSSNPVSPDASPKDVRPHPQPQQVRRHSHPRHARHGSVSSDASDEDDGPHSPKKTASAEAPRRRSHTHSSHIRSPAEDEPGSARFTPPDPRARERREREREREEELKRKSFPIPIDLSGKLSAPFLLGKRDREERERVARSGSRGAGNVRWKDLSDPDLWKRGSKESSQEEDPPRRSRDDRAEYNKRRSRDRDRDRDRERPRSSHDEVPRRERDRDRDRDRERERDHRSFRDRDRERRAVSPVRGVDGRRYPAHA
ncbi:hypothetical protein LSUE1_G003019 [Lachnellula suecica]|uniref:DUF7514 domain-containing protein n=1 Tax=Lachnellula suecica TaxID=602035 RepID=A0A8T9CJ79_9HELO|nr:hypothetical protein LSUE1_G003019 [Lachnellula suecica]